MAFLAALVARSRDGTRVLRVVGAILAEVRGVTADKTRARCLRVWAVTGNVTLATAFVTVLGTSIHCSADCVVRNVITNLLECSGGEKRGRVSIDVMG